MKIIWAKSAIKDLKRLREFIAKHNPQAAQKAAEKILSVADILRKHPEIGKPVENFLNYRDYNIKFGLRGYILRYRIYKDDLYIVQLKHYKEFGFEV